MNGLRNHELISYHLLTEYCCARPRLAVRVCFEGSHDSGNRTLSSENGSSGDEMSCSRCSHSGGYTILSRRMISRGNIEDGSTSKRMSAGILFANGEQNEAEALA